MPTTVLNGVSNDVEMEEVDVGFQGHRTPHFNDEQQVVPVDNIRGGKAAARSDSDEVKIQLHFISRFLHCYMYVCPLMIGPSLCQSS